MSHRSWFHTIGIDPGVHILERLSMKSLGSQVWDPFVQRIQSDTQVLIRNWMKSPNEDSLKYSGSRYIYIFIQEIYLF